MDGWMDGVTCAFSDLGGEKVQPAPPGLLAAGVGEVEVGGGTWRKLEGQEVFLNLIRWEKL